MTHLRADGDALARAAEKDTSARVPGCPDWDVAQLVMHVGEVHRFWCDIARRKLQHPSEARHEESPPEGIELFDWYRAGLRGLVEVLESADPATPVWSWSRQKNIAFIQRRMAQETAVHRWDAQSAVEHRASIDGDLAADGIDELFDIFAPAESSSPAGTGETIHLHRTDGDGEWLIRLDEDAMTVTREHSKGDVALRGSASDLLLVLWGRLPPDAVEVLGDHAVIVRFLEWANLD